MTIRAWVTACGCSAVFLGCAGLAAAQSAIGYKLLATSKTSTMEREMNGAADAGFRFAGVMGGDTAAGGQEVVAIMTSEGEAVNGRFHYKLLATTKTSTMQKEMQAVGDAGYEYKGQTVFKSALAARRWWSSSSAIVRPRRRFTSTGCWRRARPRRWRRNWAKPDGPVSSLSG